MLGGIDNPERAFPTPSRVYGSRLVYRFPACPLVPGKKGKNPFIH
jgi:hypothetical protein